MMCFEAFLWNAIKSSPYNYFVNLSRYKRSQQRSPILKLASKVKTKNNEKLLKNYL